MITAMTLMTIAATDSPIDAWPSLLAQAGSDTALVLATTAHTYHLHVENFMAAFWINRKIVTDKYILNLKIAAFAKFIAKTIFKLYVILTQHTLNHCCIYEISYT